MEDSYPRTLSATQAFRICDVGYMEDSYPRTLSATRAFRICDVGFMHGGFLSYNPFCYIDIQKMRCWLHGGFLSYNPVGYTNVAGQKFISDVAYTILYQ